MGSRVVNWIVAVASTFAKMPTNRDELHSKRSVIFRSKASKRSVDIMTLVVEMLERDFKPVADEKTLRKSLGAAMGRKS